MIDNNAIYPGISSKLKICLRIAKIDKLTFIFAAIFYQHIQTVWVRLLMTSISTRYYICKQTFNSMFFNDLVQRSKLSITAYRHITTQKLKLCYHFYGRVKYSQLTHIVYMQ